ncbi:DUF397 domain-containing protein [Kitasatospora sp. NPDC089509]|uniref:DUF397 domain-containing protein n=1 Tax=Kitasatospora sp. NPDC089509 TaxID=3364079 RepID=UPI0038128B4A
MDFAIPANGVSAGSLAVAWEKSPYSFSDGNCVEVAGLPDGVVAFRNSRDPHGPALIFTHGEGEAFAKAVADGAFDHLFFG